MATVAPAPSATALSDALLDGLPARIAALRTLETTRDALDAECAELSRQVADTRRRTRAARRAYRGASVLVEDSFDGQRAAGPTVEVFPTSVVPDSVPEVVLPPSTSTASVSSFFGSLRKTISMNTLPKSFSARSGLRVFKPRAEPVAEAELAQVPMPSSTTRSRMIRWEDEL